MQKWLPDAFTTDSLVGAAVADDPGAFLAEHGTVRAEDLNPASRFRSEAGFADAQTLLNHLTRKERAELFDLVEQDVSAEYQEREDELRKQFAADLQEQQNTYLETLGTLAGQLEMALGQQIKETSEACARLAVQIAEKIVRSRVAVDGDVLFRALETIQYKLLDSGPLQLTVNPEDAELLRGKPEFLATLRVKDIQSDRRIAQGGCLVRAGKEEWDATIAKQLETLGEMVEEAIATAQETPLKHEPESEEEEPREPGLE